MSILLRERLFLWFEYNWWSILNCVHADCLHKYISRKTFILTIWEQSVEYLEMNTVRCHEYIMEQDNYWENVYSVDLSTIAWALWVEYYQIVSMCRVYAFVSCLNQYISIKTFILTIWVQPVENFKFSALKCHGKLLRERFFCWFEYNHESEENIYFNDLSTIGWVLGVEYSQMSRIHHGTGKLLRERLFWWLEYNRERALSWVLSDWLNVLRTKVFTC